MTTADHDQYGPTTDALEVAAFRFSADPPSMAKLLTLLGLSLRISTEAGSWLELQAAHGSVSLHGAAASATNSRAGTTDLVLIARDVPEFARRSAGREGLLARVVVSVFAGLVVFVLNAVFNFRRI